MDYRSNISRIRGVLYGPETDVPHIMRINLNNAHSTEVLLRQLMIIKKDRAIELLKLGSGLANANFREGQEEAIRHIVEARGRLLVVQKTGWGKSFVYFIATKLLREAGAGPALLISPLLALMRNQIAAAERMGVRAVTINSDNQDEWANVEAAIQHNEVDILLISPERLAN
jgi:ATP-dependent DNA helicase RecQ